MQDPPDGYPRISPYLLYEDAGAAADWVTSAFGFTERMRMQDDDGRVTHIELELDGGVVMMGTPGSDYRSPKSLGQPTCLLYVYVDELDALFRRAVEAGAEVLEEPTDQEYGDRRCMVKDPEGHQWCFAQHLGPAGA